jgi:hypothetical protein
VEKAMSDDFGLLTSMTSPLLSRIEREERLKGDQPRKQPLYKPKPAKKDSDSPSEDEEKTDGSTSSKRIDLRI